jgi:formamidopyrimidine-DNA glycosylase
MPELPEVETLRRGLERHLMGRTLGVARVRVAKMLKGTFRDSGGFSERLQGARIESIGRRGKHLIIALDSGYYLLLHLNMRGQLLVATSETPEAKYLAAAFPLDDGNELRFHDMWTWGEMRLVSSEELAGHPALSMMGPEPFSQEWTPQRFSAGLARRPKTAIKTILLDQGVVAGVGNIYADESLYRAGVHPLRPAASLNEAETERLHREIKAVLLEATDGGGTTSDNYVDAEGQVGRYTPRVYDRNGKPCLSCGQPLTKIRVTGRGTVYCPSCQK